MIDSPSKQSRLRIGNDSLGYTTNKNDIERQRRAARERRSSAPGRNSANQLRAQTVRRAIPQETDPGDVVDSGDSMSSEEDNLELGVIPASLEPRPASPGAESTSSEEDDHDKMEDERASAKNRYNGTKRTRVISDSDVSDPPVNGGAQRKKRLSTFSDESDGPVSSSRRKPTLTGSDKREMRGKRTLGSSSSSSSQGVTRITTSNTADRRMNKSREIKNSGASQRKAIEEIVIQDDSSTEDSMPKPNPIKAKSSITPREAKLDSREKAMSSKGKGKARAQNASAVSSSDELPTLEEYRVKDRIASSKGQKRQRSTSTEEDADSTPPRKRRSKPHKSLDRSTERIKAKNTKSHQRREHRENDTSEPEVDSDGFVVNDTQNLLGERPSKRKSKVKKRNRKEQRKERRKTVKRRQVVGTDSEMELSTEGEGDAEVTPLPKRKKSKKRNKEPSQDDLPDDDILTDDEDDLDFSGKEDVFNSRRVTGSGAMKEDRYAALRQSRQGKQQQPVKRRGMVVLSSDDSIGESGTPAHNSATRNYLGADVDESSESNSEVSDPGPAAGRWTDEEADEDDSFFVVDEEDEDDDEEVRRFRQKMSTQIQGIQYHLKTYIQWLVHLIVCPQIDWLEEDSSFEASFKMINATLKSLVQSLIGSSAWKSNFQKALDRRPYMSVRDLDLSERDGPCDACTMGKGRHSIFSSELYGPIYDPKTFKRPASDFDEDGQGEESDDLDSDDSEIADAKAEAARKAKAYDNKVYSFNLGKHCAGRAQVYHELKHWGFTTHERVARKLGSVQKVFPSISLVGKSSKEKRKVRRMIENRQRAEADRCAVELDRTGEVKQLARELEDEISKARSAFATNKV